MGRLVHRHKEYIVIEDDYNHGHIIINTLGKYRNHGHIKNLGTCKKLLKMMDKKVVSDSNYLRCTALRISLDEKYKADVHRKIIKDKEKQQYVNPSKGVRK